MVGFDAQLINKPDGIEKDQESADQILLIVPLAFKVDTSFYRKYINASGIPIPGSALVPNKAFFLSSKKKFSSWYHSGRMFSLK